MSEENVEIVRGGYNALNRRDVDLFLSYLDPEPEVDFSESIGPFSDVDRDHAEFKTFWESFFEAWDEGHWEVDELRDLGGRIHRVKFLPDKQDALEAAGQSE